MTRTGDAAVRWALGHSAWPTRMCQNFTRSTFDVPAGEPSAISAWNHSSHKHRVSHGAQVPRAVPVYWAGGTFGHTAVSLGGGLCRSTDWPSGGRVGTVAIDTITRHWGKTLLGWSETENGVRVWTPSSHPVAPDNTVALHNLRPGMTNHDVQQMQSRLNGKVPPCTADGIFGPKTRDAVARWQRKLGYRGADVNGVPGSVTMQRLGFRVTP